MTHFFIHHTKVSNENIIFEEKKTFLHDRQVKYLGNCPGGKSFIISLVSLIKRAKIDSIFFHFEFDKISTFGSPIVKNWVHNSSKK